jgi:hypothetical protein
MEALRPGVRDYAPASRRFSIFLCRSGIHKRDYETHLKEKKRKQEVLYFCKTQS